MEEGYTFEDAWFDVQDLDRLIGAEDSFKAAYARTLVRLPANVRNFGLERCLILTIGRDSQEKAACLSASMIDKRRKRWIIIADEDMDGDVESVIAHEVAHAWLGHQSSGSREDPHRNERAADDQIEAWGFSRSYPNLQD